jgi:hypothetical protein
MKPETAKTQLLICKCGSVFAAAIEPYCYTEKDWLKDLAKEVKKGATVKMVEKDSGWKFEKCKCNEDKNLKLDL